MNSLKRQVRFHHLSSAFSLADRGRLKAFIIKVFKNENQLLDKISVIFCSDAYLLDINKKSLGHDYYTDIISFPLSEPGCPIHAELYISVDRVRENAYLFKKSFANELHRVIFHGVLHLCGYMDKSRAEKSLMRRMEDHYLLGYFRNVPRGTFL